MGYYQNGQRLGGLALSVLCGLNVFDGLLDFLLALRVERTGRFIQNKYSWILEESPCNS